MPHLLIRRVVLVAIALLVALTSILWQPYWLPHTTMAQSLAEFPTLTPGDNLVVEGIPPIPQSLVERVTRYTEFRAAGLSSWHPTRREMLISTRFGDTFQVHRVQTPLGFREQLTFFSEPVRSATFQPTQGNYFVFSKDAGGNEFSQNYRYDLATGEVTLLTDGKSQNTLGIWSPDGTRMAYTSTRRNGADRDLYVTDPLNPARDRRVAELKGGGWYPVDWSPDHSQLLVVEFISINESYLWLMDLESGSKTRITNNSEPVYYSAALFSRDGQGLYVVSDREGEFQQLAYLDLARKTFRNLTRQISWDVEDIDLSEDGRHLAFVTNEDGISVLHVLDTQTEQELSLPDLPAGLISGIQWHRNNDDLGFTLTSAQSTSDVYSLSLSRQQLDRWTQSETGGLNTANFSQPELIRWPSFDGRQISGFLYRPPVRFTGKRPVVINIHGGPESQFRPRFLGRNNFYLNDLGVALIFPNVRGSTGYGKTFLKLDNGYQREDAVKDIGALLDWIATQPDLDHDRVLVTGGSYGGYMSLATATHYSDRLRAAINIVGISNFVTFLERTEDYRRDLRRVEYGDERDPAMREFLIRISPLTNADQIRVPLFVVHGQNDPRVPVAEAEQIVNRVRQNGTPVWYLMARDEGHGFAKKRNADFQFYATVKFIEQFLLGDVKR